ncbi:hypothetical protein U3C44_22730 (plasmid) [Enterobacter asburiae]|jgi:hypothetical protein|uniref:hypothetical protein n=1 Tax=Enterobacter asburiae TaxID=61645 RepID=UPI002932831F|nr:hypothetical protein [Enterobacter asburiae]EMA4739913.1 hypothetical protein [Enterobacter asburiae]
MKKLLVLLPLFLTACSSTTKTFGPDGKEAYALSCSGVLKDWGDCQKEAGRLCGIKGYDTVTVNGESGVIFSASNQSAFANTTMNRNMLIKCKS